MAKSIARIPEPPESQNRKPDPSRDEQGTREPSLMTLLQYARVAGIHLEDIVDDELLLPDRLPGAVKYRGIKSKPSPGKARD